MVPSGDVRVFSEELALLHELIASSEDVETGGELLGLWSHQGNPTIMLVSGPDDAATRTQTHFLQPPEIHMMIERQLWDRFGLQVLGIWHSHHRLGLNELSNGDRDRTRRYAGTHGRARYVEFLGFIDAEGRPRIRPYLYSDAEQLEELPARILELPGRSPIRAALRRDPPPAALHTSLLIGDPRPPAGPGTDSGDGEADDGLDGPPEPLSEDELATESIETAIADSLARIEPGGSPISLLEAPIDGRTADDARATVRFASELEPGSDAEAEWLAREIMGEAALQQPAGDPPPAAPGRAADPDDPPLAEDLAPDEDDATTGIVLTLEAALGRLPDSASGLVKLAVEDAGFVLTIDPLENLASLFFPIRTPRSIEYRTATAHPMVYWAYPDQSLTDFYYEHVAGLIELALPRGRASSRRRSRRAS